MNVSELRKLMPDKHDIFFEHYDNVINELVRLLKVEKDTNKLFRKAVEDAQNDATTPF